MGFIPTRRPSQIPDQAGINPATTFFQIDLRWLCAESARRMLLLILSETRRYFLFLYLCHIPLYFYYDGAAVQCSRPRLLHRRFQKAENAGLGRKMLFLR